MRRVLTLLLSALLLLSLCTGCSTRQWHYEELSFALPEEFQDCSRESYAADFDFLFDNGQVAIAGIRETRQALQGLGAADAQSYVQLVISHNGLSCASTQRDGIWCFTYEAVSSGTPMTYLCAVYEAEHSFWQIQTYCKTADFAAQCDTMWALISAMETA